MEDRLLQALAWLRWVVLANAVVLNVYRYDNFERPLLGMGVVAVLVLWTLLAGHWYADHARRGWPLLVADLAVAVAAMVATPLVKGADFNASVPGFWVMAALLAWAAHLRWQGGLVAAVVLAGTDLAVRQDVSQSVYGNVFLLLIGGPIVGYLAASLQQMATERDRAERAAAAAAERTRLARAVHDGVLQVLALVQRRGHELGEQGEELARLAGEQESVLRGLIRTQDAVGPVPGAVPGAPGAAGAARVVDLAAELTLLGRRPGVEVVVPAGPVRLESAAATELAAAVAACLDNVQRHVPPGDDGAPPRAWVLLEDLPDRVEVSVRDEGPGIPEGRLEQAEAEGRMGVSGSVRGRLHDLGGSATLTTGSFGTEWELVVPR
ncbi:histidine kinase [Nocardioides sp. OK12]|uniref:Signal transduction histidine kinase n=1 Tax=Nocardioides marinisabuli TaxID=419476 RepID=A0A7Y9F2L2_9ACTN|nr:DUF5931 domain-containing protein [Nocardioides sp. OK12]NYD58470.1 signal transduction histidine kinase [Nocardioides marinisabuli]GHJ58141.1 histidine kinase [Nocardioides sp. OK12]